MFAIYSAERNRFFNPMAKTVPAEWQVPCTAECAFSSRTAAARVVEALRGREEEGDAPESFSIKDIGESFTKSTSDFRESNPGLHRLYVEYAVGDLATINKAIKMLDARAHTSLSGVMCAIFAERDKLIAEDAAFAEAARLLKLATAIEQGEAESNEGSDGMPEADNAEDVSEPIIRVCKHCGRAVVFANGRLSNAVDPDDEFAEYCWIDDDDKDVENQQHEIKEC